MIRYSRSRDGNEREICQALEAIPGRDITVQPIEGGKAYKGSALPNAGTPDLLVGMGVCTWLMEVKNLATKTSSSGSAYVPEGERGPFRRPILKLCVKYSAERVKHILRKANRSQLTWWRDWAGSPVHVVTTAEDAAAVLGVCLDCGADAAPTAGLCADCHAEHAGAA